MVSHLMDGAPVTLWQGHSHAGVAALAVREGLSKKKASFGYFLDEHEHPRISRTDEYYEEKGMQFVWGMEELSIEDLNSLFGRVSLHLPKPCHSQLTTLSYTCCVLPADATLSCSGSCAQVEALIGQLVVKVSSAARLSAPAARSQ